MHLLDFTIFALTFAAGCALFLGFTYLEERRFTRHTNQAIDITEEN